MIPSERSLKKRMVEAAVERPSLLPATDNTKPSLFRVEEIILPRAAPVWPPQTYGLRPETKVSSLLAIAGGTLLVG